MTSISDEPSAIYVAGSWMTSPDVIEVRTPGDNRLVGSTYEATSDLVSEAIEAGLSARTPLAAQAPFERSEILRTIAANMLLQRELLASLLSDEAGKPIRDARTEIERAALTFRIASEETERIGGELLDLGINNASRGRLGITRRYPVGLVAGISPFNLPVSLSAHKLAPAMAIGCPIVLKIPSNAPLAMLELARIIDQAGVVEGSVSIMPMSISVGDQLVTDDRIKLLSFTGSPRVGWSMKSRAGNKKVLLELGGNAGAVVNSDADVAWAAKRCAVGAFKFAGQTCISVQRIYAHKDIFEEFLAAFITQTQALRLGDPMREDTDVGPVINEASAERVRGLIKGAIAQGARIVVGGLGEGNYLPPTVLIDVPPTASISCDEAFGPVAIVERIDDFASGLRAINESRFGLQAGIFTKDVARSFEAFDSLEVGGVIINDSPTYRVDHMPYGGVKDSGLGREGVRYAMEEMSEIRLLVFTPQF